MATESQTAEVIAKEIVVATIQSMDLGKNMIANEVPEFISNLYKTILKTVNEEDV